MTLSGTKGKKCYSISKGKSLEAECFCIGNPEANWLVPEEERDGESKTIWGRGGRRGVLISSGADIVGSEPLKESP